MWDYDMNGDEGDGDCMMECTFQFDDAEVDRKNAVQKAINRTHAASENQTSVGGLVGAISGLLGG